MARVEPIVSIVEPTGSVAKDLIAGTIGGMAQVLAGQPMDAVKVRLQSSNTYAGPLDCIKRIIAEEGVLTFYAGTTAPLVLIGACVALQFAFLEAAKRKFGEANAATGRTDFSPAQLYASGAIAGLGNALASGPIEHIRIRLQAQSAVNRVYSGPVDAVQKIYRSDGLRGIYQGQGVTTIRELHGYGAYFFSYEMFVQRYCQRHKCTRSQMPASAAASYGAISGIFLWMNIYPLDTIKSRLQTDAFPSQASSRKYNGAIDCARKIWAKEGAAGFFKGLGPTMIRAPIANSAVFLAYETARKQLG